MDSVETEAPEKIAPLRTDMSSVKPEPAPAELSRFVSRHIGPNDEEIAAMLGALGFDDLDVFIDATVPKDIRLTNPLDLPAGVSEEEALAELRGIARQNKVLRNFI